MINPEIYYLPDIAALLRVSEASVRGHIQRRTPAIPPFFRIGKRLAWRKQKFDEWLSTLSTQPQPSSVKRKRRGRPKKAE